MIAGAVVAGFGGRGLRAYRAAPTSRETLVRAAVLLLGGVGIAAVALALLPFAAAGVLSDTVVVIVAAVLLLDAAITASIAQMVGRSMQTVDES